MLTRIMTVALVGLLSSAFPAESQTDISRIDRACIARQIRLVGEFNECLSKSTARHFRSPGTFFGQGIGQRDDRCRLNFIKRMAHFSELYMNRGATEGCACILSESAAFWVDFTQTASWGRACHERMQFFIDHDVLDLSTIDGGFFNDGFSITPDTDGFAICGALDADFVAQVDRQDFNLPFAAFQACSGP